MKVPAERLHEIVRGNFCDIAELRAMAAELLVVRQAVVDAALQMATIPARCRCHDCGSHDSAVSKRIAEGR